MLHSAREISKLTRNKRRLRHTCQKKNSKLIQPQESRGYSFWDSQVLLMEHYQETGTTVNSALYSVTC
jgi:hypothetical protein